MLRARASLSWILIFAILFSSAPLVRSAERTAKNGRGKKKAESKKKSGKKADAPKAKKPPRPARPPRPPRPERPGGRAGRSGRTDRGRSGSNKRERKKREEKKRWYVVQMGRDFVVAESSKLKSLRNRATDSHRKAMSKYKKQRQTAKDAGREFDGPKPAPTIFKTLPRAGFSSEKAAKAHLARIRKNSSAKRDGETGGRGKAGKPARRKKDGKKKNKKKDRKPKKNAA